MGRERVHVRVRRYRVRIIVSRSISRKRWFLTPIQTLTCPPTGVCVHPTLILRLESPYQGALTVLVASAPINITRVFAIIFVRVIAWQNPSGARSAVPEAIYRRNAVTELKISNFFDTASIGTLGQPFPTSDLSRRSSPVLARLDTKTWLLGSSFYRGSLFYEVVNFSVRVSSPVVLKPLFAYKMFVKGQFPAVVSIVLSGLMLMDFDDG